MWAKHPRVNLAPQLDRSGFLLNLARPSCQPPTESVFSGFCSQSASYYIKYSEAGGARARSDCSGLLRKKKKKNMEEGRQEEATRFLGTRCFTIQRNGFGNSCSEALQRVAAGHGAVTTDVPPLHQ